MKKLLHPYNIALAVSIVSLGVFTYIGLVAPTSEEEQTSVKGAVEAPASYITEPMLDYGTDMDIIDQATVINGKYIDQKEVKFTAYSGAAVTYQLFKLTNRTDAPITVKFQPKAVGDTDLLNMSVDLHVNGGVFELYDHSAYPNEDAFAIMLDPYESDEARLIVRADDLEKESVSANIVFQLRAD